jgi:mitogen-activated protein kinase kinase
MRNGKLPEDVQARLAQFQAQRSKAPQAFTPTFRSGGGSVGGMMGGFQPAPAVARPVPGNWQSAPTVPGRGPSLGQRRGLMKMNMPPPAPTPSLSLNGATEEAKPNDDGANAFKKYDRFIDTKTGTLTFAGKATISSKGVEFESGGKFNISLSEVDILDELGKGNYGTVYRVIHRRPANVKATSPDMMAQRRGSTGIEMAMKEIRLELEDAKFAQIVMELEVLHKCMSPFVIDFYGAFFQEGAVYMCIEYMDGGSVDKLYKGGVPEPALRKIAYAVVKGLKCLKDEHNIIHRDVKPTNILVNTRGQVKLCDFGVSGNLVASIAKTNIGCQSYMAPERIASGGIQAAFSSGSNSAAVTYSVQSDIWSLGLSLLECGIGSYPYPPETYNTIFSQLSAIVEGSPPDLPEGFSPMAQDFVKRCLAKDPSRRPTYAVLLRHPWIADLDKINTIAEHEEDEESSMTDKDGGVFHEKIETSPISGKVLTRIDEDVSVWVANALAQRRGEKASGQGESKKPPMHAAPLDVIGTPEASPNVTDENVKSLTGSLEGLEVKD